MEENWFKKFFIIFSAWYILVSIPKIVSYGDIFYAGGRIVGALLIAALNALIARDLMKKKANFAVVLIVGMVFTFIGLAIYDLYKTAKIGMSEEELEEEVDVE